MTKNEVTKAIITLLEDSGLSFDEKVKVIAEARVSFQPRASETDWRAKAKPLLRPKDKK